MSSDNPISAAQSSNSSDSKSVAKSCPVSGESVAIVPVRYAIDDMDDKGNQLNPFPEKGNWQGPFKLKHAKYTMRRLRDGWLYVYDEDAETFHEYQVQGANLIKYDWGSDESTKEPSERGTEGDSKVYLSYPAKHTLFLGFSYHRWTWRVCEHMRSESSDRKKWMRKLDLNDYCHSDSLYNHHAGYYEGLVDAVADIFYSESSPEFINKDMFYLSSTPLVDDDNSENTPSSEKYNSKLSTDILEDSPLGNVLEHTLDYEKYLDNYVEEVASKKNKNIYRKVQPYAYLKDYELPEDTSGIFIALDDRHADICDMVSQLGVNWFLKENVTGDDEKEHKTRMAEIMRNIVTVRLKKHSEYIKEKPELILDCERKLNEFLDLDYSLHYKENLISFSKKSVNEDDFYDEDTRAKLNAIINSSKKSSKTTKEEILERFKNLELIYKVDILNNLDEYRRQYKLIKESKASKYVRFDNDSQNGLGIWDYQLEYYNQ
ncbi:hypothetical protein F9817_19130, partial [Vibrio sp. CAIM 722]|nr:hypothetical protein [Vibrio eleionomae]